MLVYSKHALEQMRYRGITERDIEHAFETLDMFECRPDYSVNFWGNAVSGRRLRITMVPEVRYIITVSEVNQVTIAHELAAKAERERERRARIRKSR